MPRSDREALAEALWRAFCGSTLAQYNWTWEEHGDRDLWLRVADAARVELGLATAPAPPESPIPTAGMLDRIEAAAREGEARDPVEEAVKVLRVPGFQPRYANAATIFERWEQLRPHYERWSDMDEAVQGTLTSIEWRKRIEKRARKLAEDAATLARDTAQQRVEGLNAENKDLEQRFCARGGELSALREENERLREALAGTQSDLAHVIADRDRLRDKAAGDCFLCGHPWEHHSGRECGGFEGIGKCGCRRMQTDKAPKECPGCDGGCESCRRLPADPGSGPQEHEGREADAPASGRGQAAPRVDGRRPEGRRREGRRDREGDRRLDVQAVKSGTQESAERGVAEPEMRSDADPCEGVAGRDRGPRGVRSASPAGLAAVEERKGECGESLGEVKATSRGFEIIDFTDRNGQECSLQQSSLGDYETPGASAVWLGCNRNAEPHLDREGKPRMHLTREQVAALIGHLQSWLDENTFGGSESGGGAEQAKGNPRPSSEPASLAVRPPSPGKSPARNAPEGACAGTAKLGDDAGPLSDSRSGDRPLSEGEGSDQDCAPTRQCVRFTCEGAALVRDERTGYWVCPRCSNSYGCHATARSRPFGEEPEV